MNHIEYNWPYKGSKLIDKQDLKPYLKRNNFNGVIHLFLHLLLILSTLLVSLIAAIKNR